MQITRRRSRSREVHVSGIVNEVIKGNLKPLYFFFYEKISHAKNAYKQTKTKNTKFLCA